MVSLWKLENSNWKDFVERKQSCVQKSVSKQMQFIFSKLKFHEIALRRPQYLNSNFAKSIKGKNVVRKNGFHRIFVTSSHIEKNITFQNSAVDNFT